MTLAPDPRTTAADADWLRPAVEQAGLQRYISTIRARWALVLAAVILCAGAAGLYVATTAKVYEATSQLLVTAVASDDPTTAGLGLIRQSSDPTRDVSTAAAFVQTPGVARRVAGQLHRTGRPEDLLAKVSAVPLAQSDIVSITAQGSTPAQAANLANAFAAQTVADRTAQLRAQVDQLIPALQRRLSQVPAGSRTGPDSLQARITGLEALRGGNDPTMRVLSPADPPLSPSKPRKKLAVAAGLFGGLVLGIAAAFGMQALDPRLRREEQLRELYRLPVLARVPLEPRSARKAGPLVPAAISGIGHEAFRTLRASLAATRAAEFKAHSVLVTGSGPSEGKTTTAINFAWSLVQAGNRVILIEADLRRPTVGLAVGAAPRHGIGAVLVNQVSLEDALVSTERFGPDLQFLLVDRAGAGMADRLSLPTARQLVRQAEALADYVVIDSPPLTEITDALPLAQEVEDVLVVVRLGKSKLTKLQQLGELFAVNDIKPTGIAVVGVENIGRDSYYYRTPEYSEDDRPALRA